MTFLKIKSSFPPKSVLVKFAFLPCSKMPTLLSDIAKEKVANLYVLDEHLKQEKGKENQFQSPDNMPISNI